MKDGTPGKVAFPFDEPPSEGSVTEIAEGVLWARLPLPLALDHVNVFALDDGDSWTIVDTGMASRRTRAIWQTLIDGPLSGRPIGRVIVTHHHPDHVGLAGWMMSEFGATILATRTTWLFARMLQLDAQDRPVPETVSFWKAAGMDPEILAARMAERPFNYADCTAPLPLGFEKLAEGTVVTAAGRQWTTRLGSGHAPDHATFWSMDDTLVLAGDQLLPAISPNIGVYATEPEGDPLADWIETCDRFADVAHEQHLVLPGHKLPYTGLPTRLRQLTENHHGALRRLIRHLETPAPAGKCFQPLFGREIRAGEYGLALVEAMAHCLHLWHKGQVEREITEDGTWLWTASRS